MLVCLSAGEAKHAGKLEQWIQDRAAESEHVLGHWSERVGDIGAEHGEMGLSGCLFGAHCGVGMQVMSSSWVTPQERE